MKEIKKSRTSVDSCSFSSLPDEMVLQILDKLIDLKILCLCKLVSKRFNQIVSQVNTISFTALTDPILEADNRESEASNTAASVRPFFSAYRSLMKFCRVKSVHIQLPSSIDSLSLFKWEIKFGNRFEAFSFLSPDYIYHKKELYVYENGQDEENDELFRKKVKTSGLCLEDALKMITVFFAGIIRLPLLEKVSIVDSDNRGKVSFSGGRIVDLRNLLCSQPDTIEQRLKYLDFPSKVSGCYVPLLELPVSGYVMKGVTLVLFLRDDLPDDIDSFMKSDDNVDVKDKEEAVYAEAMMQILKKHRGRMRRLGVAED